MDSEGRSRYVCQGLMKYGLGIAMALLCACASSGGGGSQPADAGSGGSGSGGAGATDVHCISSSDGCYCVADPTHDFTEGEGVASCNIPDPLGGVCCRSPEYPSGSDCKCLSWGCYLNSLGCWCSGSESAQPLKTCTGAGTPYCCATYFGDELSSCRCATQPLACDGVNEKKVGTCLGPLDCPIGKLATNSCKGTPGAGGSGGAGGASGGTGGGPTGGAGGAGGSGGSGGSGGGADPCSDCISTSCASQMAACNAHADCAALLACAESCTTDPCYTACLNAHPSGATVFDAVAQCVNDYCSAECA